MTAEGYIERGRLRETLRRYSELLKLTVDAAATTALRKLIAETEERLRGLEASDDPP